jgi:hypothetical protein
MGDELQPGFEGGEQVVPIPARENGNAEPTDCVEIEVKESIIIDELFENRTLVSETVLKVLEVDIEGRKHNWHKETITAAEVAQLGGWHASQGVLHIDADNCERTITELEEVKIEVGVSFAKRVRFKRG